MKQSILIIDDERAICASLALVLAPDYDVSTALDAETGLKMIQEKTYHLVLLDLKIGDMDGIEVLRQIKAYDNSIAVIIMTAYGSIRSSVEAMKCGAFTYLSKPLDIDELLVFISQALEFRHLNEQVKYLHKELQSHYSYGEMVGESEPMQKVYHILKKVKDVNVMITGESGTGKELVARAVHYQGKRKNEQFVAVNCAAIPEGLLEEEFFGHKKGAFTGAIRDKQGKLKQADGGTLFLDEVGDMPLALQGKLLRVLEQREFTPIGGTETIKIDIQVIAATNRNLHQMVEEGKFRRDLYYRLNIMEIHLPPLRERQQDVLLLADHFLNKYSRAMNRPKPELGESARKVLMAYSFPGNVRELANALELAMILCGGDVIEAEDLPHQMQEYRRENTEILEMRSDDSLENMLAGFSLAEIEKMAIRGTLKKYNGKQKPTAESLGISDRGLRNKIKEYGLVE